MLSAAQNRQHRAQTLINGAADPLPATTFVKLWPGARNRTVAALGILDRVHPGPQRPAPEPVGKGF
jgi:hypothetical protein